MQSKLLLLNLLLAQVKAGATIEVARLCAALLPTLRLDKMLRAEMTHAVLCRSR
jgi:hypothetical protein